MAHHMTGEMVTLVEVGPRDGLQNEAQIVPVAEKVALIKALDAAALSRIEVGSFVHPKWVPQMADTAEVLRSIDGAVRAKTSVLIPNQRGWQGFCDASEGLSRPPGEVAVFVSATEGFSQANLNCSIAESFDRIAPVAAAALDKGLRLRGYVSCVTDCPYEGRVSPDAVAKVAARLLDLGAAQVSLGETLGRAEPSQVRALLDAVLPNIPAAKLAGHFHDTQGLALGNIDVCLQAGLRVFDTSIAGLGGCPYAPGAPGNVATEAVQAHLTQAGYVTGVDAAKLAQAVGLAQRMVGHDAG